MSETMRTADDIIIRRAGADEMIDLRHRVLRAGLARETAVFPGDDDADARHFAAERAGRVIGCVTLMLNEWTGEPAWQLRGMAVEPKLQRSGLGARLLAAAEESVRDQASPTRLMWCNARTPAMKFYGKHGWQVMSEAFDIPFAGPHVKMIKRV
jgi:GNAT superfamily N-acetyltransferase